MRDDEHPPSAEDNPQPPDDERLLTSEEAAAWLRVSRSTLYRLVGSDRLARYKIAGHWRFFTGDLQRLVQGLPMLDRPVGERAPDAHTSGTNVAPARVGQAAARRHATAAGQRYRGGPRRSVDPSPGALAQRAHRERQRLGLPAPILPRRAGVPPVTAFAIGDRVAVRWTGREGVARRETGQVWTVVGRLRTRLRPRDTTGAIRVVYTDQIAAILPPAPPEPPG
jgi:excisionase family DNA binding protein